MVRSVWLVIAAGVLSHSACDTLGIPAETEVRVHNASAVAFDEVTYWAGSRQFTYSAVAPGQSTPYVEADRAYGYTTVLVVVGPDTLLQQVIDYVGEEPLSGGRYSYVLTVVGDPGARSMGQSLRVER